MSAYLAEVLAKKRILDRKIKEVKSILRYEQNDTLAQELFALLELRQGKLLHIEAANHTSKINIGGTEVSIAVALHIRNTIKEKIDVLTGLINARECPLDKIELQQQRDKYYDDFILLTMGITRNDLNVSIG